MSSARKSTKTQKDIKTKGTQITTGEPTSTTSLPQQSPYTNRLRSAHTSSQLPIQSQPTASPYRISLPPLPEQPLEKDLQLSSSSSEISLSSLYNMPGDDESDPTERIAKLEAELNAGKKLISQQKQALESQKAALEESQISLKTAKRQVIGLEDQITQERREREEADKCHTSSGIPPGSSVFYTSLTNPHSPGAKKQKAPLLNPGEVETVFDPEGLATSDHRSPSGMAAQPDEQANVMAHLLEGKQLTNRYLKKVGECNGKDSAKVLAWLRKLDETPTPVALAKASAEGPLLTYVTRANIDDWSVLRQGIASTFISAAFQQCQKEALENLRQRPNESLESFNHEFHALLKEASGCPMDQQELIRTYLSALHDRALARSILADNSPSTLKEAVTLVREKSKAEQMLKPVKTGKVHELAPEVNALTDATQALLASQATLQGQVAALTQQQRQLTSKHSPRFNVNLNQSASKCFRCGKPGHFAKECRTPRLVNDTDYRQKSAQGINATPKQKSTGPQRTDFCSCNIDGPPGELKNCDRCRQTGHTVKNCRTGPPRTPCYCGGRHWLYDCPERKKAKSNQGN